MDFLACAFSTQHFSWVQQAQLVARNNSATNNGGAAIIGTSYSVSIQEYHFDDDPDTPNEVRLELIRGGFRTIIGAVGDSEEDTYLLTTPDADVTVSGTTYDCVIENGKTYCGAYDGGITVSNQSGSVDLGLGADYDYLEVVNRLMPPLPLLQQPTALEQLNQNDDDDDYLVGSSNSPTSNVQPPASTSNTVSTIPVNTIFPEPKPIRVTPYKKENSP